MTDAAPAFASASDTTEQEARLLELAKGVYGYVSDYDPNCGFVVGDDGVLVVDARATPRLARQMVDAIRSVTDKPIKYLVLTHYHAVRVLGASAFEGATILASDATCDLIDERGAADMESEIRRFPRLFQGKEEIPGLTFPRVSFDRELTFRFGGRQVRILHLGRAHTKGDTAVWLPGDGVVFAGDLVENRCGVYAGDAYFKDWPTTLERLRALGCHAMVPGRGAAVTSRVDVNMAIDATKDFLLTLYHAVELGIVQGETMAACYERAKAAMDARFADWPIYQHVLPFDVARAYDEIRGFEHPVIWTAARDAELWSQVHRPG
jgi:glyoxylase-like metal-dependent hydrolase (beta-lactamase superfamily II)